MLTSLLRDRGLNLQTSKTKILVGKDAEKHIEGVQPIIENILAELEKLEAEEKQEVEEEVKAKEQKKFEDKKEDVKPEPNPQIDFESLVSSFVVSLKSAASSAYTEDDITVEKEPELEIIEQTAYSNIEAVEDNTVVAEFEVVSSTITHEDQLLVAKDGEVVEALINDAVRSSDPETVDISIIKKTFDAFFINSQEHYFDKTLFRFLIKRLSKVSDSFAVEYCKTLFEAHPEETATLLKYFKDIGVVAEAFEAIESFLFSKDSIYHYQNYQIIEWMDTCEDVSPSEAMISLVRKYAFDNTKPYYLRSVSRKYLCRFASISDLEALEKTCKEATDMIEQAELICFLQKMEKNRRNSTYSRIERKNILNKCAVIYAKSLDAASKA